MGKANIHPLAVVEAGAILGEDVVIEAFAVIKAGVVLKDRVVVKSHAYIDGNTTIGEGTIIWPSASIGTKTQDRKFRGEKTYVFIGKNCEIREFATINASCSEGSMVKIGDNCLIMAYCHVAHNCEVGDHVIMTNNSLLAGHVIVESFAIIGGMTPIHQYCKIGCHAMVGGFSRVTQDVPPYTVGGGVPYEVGAINWVGLKRRRFPLDVRTSLAKAFRILYRTPLHLEDALKRIEEEVDLLPEVVHLLDFCRNSKRGLIGRGGIMKTSEKSESLEFETNSV